MHPRVYFLRFWFLVNRKVLVWVNFLVCWKLEIGHNTGVYGFGSFM